MKNLVIVLAFTALLVGAVLLIRPRRPEPQRLWLTPRREKPATPIDALQSAVRIDGEGGPGKETEKQATVRASDIR